MENDKKMYVLGEKLEVGFNFLSREVKNENIDEKEVILAFRGMESIFEFLQDNPQFKNLDMLEIDEKKLINNDEPITFMVYPNKTSEVI